MMKWLVSILTPLILMLMTVPSFAQDKIVIAHRGASGYLPEHTLAAKAMAHAMGADFLEQDLVLSKDGVPIVLHDHHLDTISDVATKFPGRARKDGRFYAIDFTLSEIKSLNAHERIDLKTGKAVFPNRFPVDQSHFEIPTLEEELQLIQGLNKSTGKTVGIYPEIKAPAFHRAEGQDISKIVLAILAQYGYAEKTDPVYLQCFDWNETQRIRNDLGYKGKLVQLIAENSWQESPNVDFDALRTEKGIKEIAKIADGIGPWIPHIVTGEASSLKFSDLVKNAHENGLAVHPYTLRADDLPDWANSLDEVMNVVLFEAGADGIFSDFTDKSVHYLEKRQQNPVH